MKFAFVAQSSSTPGPTAPTALEVLKRSQRKASFSGCPWTFSALEKKVECLSSFFTFSRPVLGPLFNTMADRRLASVVQSFSITLETPRRLAICSLQQVRFLAGKFDYSGKAAPVLWAKPTGISGTGLRGWQGLRRNLAGRQQSVPATMT